MPITKKRLTKTSGFAAKNCKPPITGPSEFLKRVIKPNVGLIKAVGKKNGFAGQDLNDVVQETSFRALKMQSSFVYDKNPKGWIGKIAKNVCRNFYGKRKKEPKNFTDVNFLIDLLEEDKRRQNKPPKPLTVAQQKEGVQRILAALEKESEINKSIVLYKYGLNNSQMPRTVNQTAKKFGLPAGTVMSKIHRTTQRIKKCLK